MYFIFAWSSWYAIEYVFFCLQNQSLFLCHGSVRWEYYPFYKFLVLVLYTRVLCTRTLSNAPDFPSNITYLLNALQHMSSWMTANLLTPVMLVLVLVLVLKDSLRTKMQSLSWSLSLTMQSLSLSLSLLLKSLSLSLSLLLKSLSLSWSLNKSPWSCPCDWCCWLWEHCIHIKIRLNVTYSY